ncbi:MAG: hypothetical protein ACTHQM_25745 [Thermoanaerobaculia bacterium]
MANLFPEIYPNDWTPEYERFQDRDTAKNGALQISSYDPVAQFFAKGVWNTLTRVEFDLLEDHWHSNAATPFDLFDYFSHKQRQVYVAVADGVSTIYTLPAKTVVLPLVYVAGVLATVQPALLVGSGPQGEDQIQFAFANRPASGSVITFNAPNACRRYEVQYGNVRFRGRHREADVWSVEAEFIQKVVA